MHLYNKDSKLADILLADPSALTIFNRFGIFLGVGDSTVASACGELGINREFFLAIVNTYFDERYTPEETLRTFDVVTVIDYLGKTDDYYAHFQLPNIERHFNSLVSANQQPNNNLDLLRMFFMQMKQELMASIESDRNVLFPLLRRLNDEGFNADDLTGLKEEVVDTSTEDKIDDLLSFFIIHLQGAYDINLCRAVVSALVTLRKDVNQNNRIRRLILKPLIDSALGKNSNQIG